MKKHDILEQKMCKELDMLEEKYRTAPGDMNVQDLDKIDKLYHALKSKATYDAMKEAEEDYQDQDGMSGRRGRDYMGRYVSRDNGYSGYPGREPMDAWSGHYPMNPPYYRW